MPNTSGLKPWVKGQSGNPGGRPKGVPTLHAQLRRLRPEALEALRSCLVSNSRVVRLAAYKVWHEVFERTKPVTAARRLVEGDYTEAELIQLEEQAKQEVKQLAAKGE